VIFILLQSIILLANPKFILSKTFKINVNNHSLACTFVNVFAILIAVNYYLYFKEVGTKRITKKHYFYYLFSNRNFI